jgi:hypothetical protein
MDHTQVNEALRTWTEKQRAYTEAKEAYRAAWASEFAARESVKPEAARKAQADVVTHASRLNRDLLEVEATTAWQAFIVLRGPMDHARQPGNNFDEAA